MNDFLRHILNELSDAVSLAVLAVIFCTVCVAAVYIIFKIKYKGSRKFPIGKVLLILILAAYITVVLSVTVMRWGGVQGFNFRLFRAWREAWNNFSFKSWANVLLNIAMFVPLGVLLPWLHKLFEKWYFTVGSGFAFSLAIEIVQGFTQRGLFDVDDLFTNTLGAVFGYGLFMTVRCSLAVSERNKARIIAYASVPLIIIIGISSIFIFYAVKDYGNLHDAPVGRVSTEGVEWKTEYDLSDESRTVSVYKAKTYNSKTCDEFGKAFLDGRTTKELDICYYDGETYYLDHSEHSLFVSHLDRSYEYTYHPNEGQRTPAEADRETIEKLLSGYGIVIPDNAVFTYESEGWHSFSVPMEKNAGDTVGGTLRCRYSSEGFVYVIHNNMISYEYCADERIISELQAFEKMKKGCFLGGVFEMMTPKAVTVLSCTLEYQVDTKGFYQPVYIFKVMYDGVEDDMGIMIPALN